MQGPKEPSQPNTYDHRLNGWNIKEEIHLTKLNWFQKFCGTEKRTAQYILCMDVFLHGSGLDDGPA